jgi:hypothetical protein
VLHKSLFGGTLNEANRGHFPSDSRYGAFLSETTFHNQDGKAKDETPGQAYRQREF